MQKIIHFFKTYRSFPNTLILGLILLCFLLGALFNTLNHLFFHYTTIILFSPNFGAYNLLIDISIILFCLGLFFYGIAIAPQSPRASTFLWGLSAITLTYYANVVITNGIVTTPFPPIDHTLAKIDTWLGINTPAIMAWTHAHPFWHAVFNKAYASLTYQLILIPISLACLNAKKQLQTFLIAQLITAIIGSLIYYFLPTAAPSSMFHSPYFITAQHDTAMRFHQVHHFIKLTTTQGGLIAFPSFHVMWAILFTYCVINKKWLFYPLAFLNIFLIASTVFLGWHYFTDVVSGALLAVLGIWLAKRCERGRFRIPLL